jgi:neutral trehalase
MLAHCRVCFSFRKLHFQASHRNANPTQELSFIRSFRFIRSFHYRHFCFSTLQIHVLTAWLHFVQLSLSTLTKTPCRSFTFFNYIRSLLPALAFSNALFEQKNAPNQLPAAPCHSALRYPCQGHSLNTQTARPQRTGLNLHYVTLHFAFKPCYPR